MPGLVSNVGRWFGSTWNQIRGGQAMRPDSHERPKLEEKVYAGPFGIKFPWFAPYLDNVTHETQEMRLAYRQMFADPIIKPALLGKIFGVACQELQVHPARKKEERDQAISDFVEYCITSRCHGGVAGIAWSILSGGLIDGYSICEKVWALETRGVWKGKRVLRALKPKMVGDDLIIQTDPYRNIVSLLGIRYNAGLDFYPRDFVIFNHLPLYGQPIGQSDLRAAYSRWWFLDTVTKLRAMAAEKRVLPLLKGTWTVASTRASLETALSTAKSLNWMSLPDTVKVEALDIAGRSESDWASFRKDLVEEIIMSISLAYLQMVTGGQGEQRGDTKTHKDTSDLAKWYLSESLLTVLNDQETGLIPDIVDTNFQDAEYPKATFGGIDEAELKESLVIDTGLYQLGFPLSKEDLAERYGRPLATEPEDTLQQQPKPEGMPGLPGAPGGGGSPFGGPPGGNGHGGNGNGRGPEAPPQRPFAMSTNGPANRLMDMNGQTQPARMLADSPVQHAAIFADEGRWITIGAKTGKDGKKCGGSPVFIQNGRITKGHPGLTGKKIGALKADTDPSTHRQQLNQSKDYARAVWGKKARQEGIPTQHLHQLAAEVLAHDKEFKQDQTKVLQEARKLSSRLGYGDIRNLKQRNASGRLDADQIRGLDDVAARIAEQHPEHFPDPDNAPDRLYEMLVEGNPEPMTEEEAYQQAYDHLEEMKARHPTGEKTKQRTANRTNVPEEPIPFAEDAQGHDHGKDGQFAPKGKGSSGSSSDSSSPSRSRAEVRAGVFRRSAGHLSSAARATVQKAKQIASKKFAALESRYGRKGAIAVMSAALALTPIPLPGTSLAPVAIAEAVLAAHKLWKGPTVAVAHAEGLSAEDLEREVMELVHAMYDATNETPPEFRPEQLAKALRSADVEPAAQKHAEAGTDLTPDPAEKQIAGRGSDQEKAEDLLEQAKEEGTATLARIVRPALERLLAPKTMDWRTAKRFLTDQERQQLADSLAATTGTAELLGRSRIRLREQQAKKHAEQFGEARDFSEELTSFAAFDEAPLGPLAPTKALSFFKRLVPTLGIRPGQWTQEQQKKAFSLAVATEQTILERIKDLIAERLETGAVTAGPHAVAAILDDAGVSPRNPQYGEMVYRTNMQNAYAEGTQQELAEATDSFPVWKYVGIHDGRQRHAHEVHFDKYYPSSVPFTEVRDSVKGSYDGFNDRCNQIPIYQSDWRRLQEQGARIDPGWENR